MAYIKKKSERKFKITVCNGYKVNGQKRMKAQTSVVRSGLKLSTISGSCQPCFCQTVRMLGKPLPARSPTLIRLNILMSDSFRGSDTPPTRASCTLMRKAPGLAMRILSGHF